MAVSKAEHTHLLVEHTNLLEAVAKRDRKIKRLLKTIETRDGQNERLKATNEKLLLDRQKVEEILQLLGAAQKLLY